ncbi:MAG TPA: PBP1A family penicillin-binding protein, partial [Armatimonadota bacterium]
MGRNGVAWWEWAWLCGIYGAVIVGMSFLGATMRPYYLTEDRYHGPTRIYSCDGVLLASLYEQYRVPVTIDQVPASTIHAILAAEDADFFQHRGLNGRGILRALWADLRAGRLVQGGSSITQQLVRTELLNDNRSLRRKAYEAVLAMRIERTYTKAQILERYLNAVYFGGGAYGIGAAAQSYFGKPVAKLSPAESAVLVSLIRAPGEGNPRFNRPLALRRQRSVLATMLAHGWLTPRQYQQALHEQITIRPRKPNRWLAPYAVEAIREWLIAQYGRARVYQGGLTIRSTIDSRLQRAAERALRAAVHAGRQQRVGNGALVAMETQTGYIDAMVGGTDFGSSQYNRAMQAHRQPGSAFKVFVYQAALDAGRSLDDVEMDAPLQVDQWSPHNYKNRYHGQVTLQEALAQSLNSVAVRLVVELSPYAVIAAARDAGITSPLNPNMSIALGSSEVTPLEMARAFATFANGGDRQQPSLILSVETERGQIYRYEPNREHTVSPDTAFLLTQGLQSVITNGTGKRARIGRPAAGKTGTSSFYRDAWFVGYTPQLCTAVWLGNDDRHPMAGVAGGSLPAQAWATFMRVATQGQPATDFTPPPTLVQVEICTASGKLAVPGCPHTRMEYIAPRHLPNGLCDLHAQP